MLRRTRSGDSQAFESVRLASRAQHILQEVPIRRSLVLVPLLLLILLAPASNSWSSPQQLHRQTPYAPLRTITSALAAKRNRRQNSRQDDDDLNRWYDSVDDNASPDDVFWKEMERQRLVSNNTTENAKNPAEELASRRFASATAGMASHGDSAVSKALSSLSSSTASSSSSSAAQPPLPMNTKNTEATLSEYEAYAVSDNWLDDELLAMMMENDDFFSQEATPLEEQLEEWEAEDDDDGTAWMQSDEPWDHWGEPKEESDGDDRNNQIRIDPNNKAAEFLFKEEDDEQERLESEAEEAAYLQRLGQLKISSHRLERARNSPKATAFFHRKPDEIEGYDRLWVSAVDNACFKNLVGTFRNYGVQFADNFGDFQDGCLEDGFASVEDVASFKARKVFEVTGLPCIASRTSFEVEPIPDLSEGAGRTSTTSPRVTSGYRFNDVGLYVDYVCEALRPVSDPSRMTRFKTCLCYYDGEMEVFDYGVCDVDLIFANSMRTFIPVSQAINEMLKTMQLTFGLEYEKWIKNRVEESVRGIGGASLKLRDRVLKEGRVLPNDIVDVSSFMDAKVDVNLMDDCAKELSQRFVDQKPNKILTVATTGLVIALPMAKYLQVPVVYARKERSVVMADTFKATYSSNTMGKNRELLVSTAHLDEDDRVLIVDDFLSSGSSQEALLRIVSESGATAVGVGVLLEKVYDSGRQSLSGFDVPVHSLCGIASVSQGAIQLLEEEGFDDM